MGGMGSPATVEGLGIDEPPPKECLLCPRWRDSVPGELFCFGTEMTTVGHILLVDDDEAFSYSASKALQNAGFNVLTASDHRLALQILEGPQTLDLLITDLVMPDRVNGFALARMARIKRIGLRILYVTAYGDIPTNEASGKIFAQAH